MDSISKPLKKFYIVYINDIFVFILQKKNIQNQHKIICEKFQENRIMLSQKKKKPEMEQTTIKFLELILNLISLKLQNHVISKVKDFSKVLQNKNQI